MNQTKKFTIEVTSSYAEFWRYNVVLMCGCFDADDVRSDFVSTEDRVAIAGSNLTAPPEDYPTHRATKLETTPAHHLILYVYIIPHTLPLGREVATTKPFALNLHITSDKGQILKSEYQINQWSGASIELRVPAPISIE